ncbi:MAG: hypothetical protein ABEH43_05470, partial [Flavobacteriales bacterium]
GSWKTLKKVSEADERYTDFKAFKSGKVYDNTGRINKNGANAYWEEGVTNPHIVLKDMVKIFHPELLPDYEMEFYQKLKKKEPEHNGRKK